MATRVTCINPNIIEVIDTPMFDETAERSLARNIMSMFADDLLAMTQDMTIGGIKLADLYSLKFGFDHPDNMAALAHWVEYCALSSDGTTEFKLSSSIQNC